MSSDEGDKMSSLRRRSRSPAAAPPLEDDDLLSEILLRLPPQPSSLPRASAVAKRWRSLASDPRFCSRFRAHHRRNPPFLGCFVKDFSRIHFQPALEPPNRLPQDCFSFPISPRPRGDRFRPLGCRHGLALILSSGIQLVVWDPVTGEQHRLDTPPGFDDETKPISAAVFRAAGDIHHFLCLFLGDSCVGRSHLHTTSQGRFLGFSDHGLCEHACCDDWFQILGPAEATFGLCRQRVVALVSSASKDSAHNHGKE